MSDRLGAADPRLADPEWMRRAYAQHGDLWIALETGANRKTVRRRREELGIQAASPGRRRNTPTRPATVTTSPAHSPAVGRILRRVTLTADPPSAGRALELFADADRARRDHDRTSERVAWERLAAHCIRIVEHHDAIDGARG